MKHTLPDLLNIVGQSGAGKGTTAGIIMQLCREYSIPYLYISSGELVRWYTDAFKATPIGKDLLDTNNQGRRIEGFFVEAFITFEIIPRWTAGTIVIMDGTPRFAEQCDYLNKWMSTNYFKSWQILEVITNEEKCTLQIIARTEKDRREDLTENGEVSLSKIQTKMSEWTSGCPEIRQYAQVHGVYDYITNDGTIEELAEKIHKKYFLTI